MRRQDDMRDGDGDRDRGDRGDRGGRGGRGGGDWSTRREGPGGKMIGAIIALVVLVIFAVQNLEEKDVDFLFWDWNAPFAVTIAIAGLLGFLIGWLLGRASGKRRAIQRISSD